MDRKATLLAGAAALVVAAVGAGLVLTDCRGPDSAQPGPAPPGTSTRPGTSTPSTAGTGSPPTIRPSIETELFPGASGDVADDSAIWRNPQRPVRSFVLADDKSDHGGVSVYALDGRLVHHEPSGKIGNIDLRDDVRLGDRLVVLVGANDRSRNTLRFWTLDRDTGRLTSAETGQLPTLAPNYGFCLGRDTTGGHVYAFVSALEAGGFEQYELRLSSGRVEARRVRAFDVGSQSEGCVVDDTTGALYVAEEDVGIWRYGLDPATGARRTAVDSVGKGHLTADVEGVSAARAPDGRDVLVASSQGDSTFSVYDLDGRNAYRGSFQVGRNNTGSVDGASETDGLAVAAGDFGPAFPRGLLVVHDARNTRPDGGDEPGSNLKLARLDQVLALAPGA